MSETVQIYDLWQIYTEHFRAGCWACFGNQANTPCPFGRKLRDQIAASRLSFTWGSR